GEFRMNEGVPAALYSRTGIVMSLVPALAGTESTFLYAMYASRPDCTVLYSCSHAFACALVVRPTRLRVTIAASTPRIVTTTRSSIRVNPDCPFLPRMFLTK